MRKEIGSEFWSVPVKQNNGTNFYPDETQWFLSGRSALGCIISDIKNKDRINKVALPSWCCESIIKPFYDANLTVEFYPVYYEDKQLKRDLANVEECDSVLVMDYFGFSRFEDFHKDGSLHVIRDVTHSIFSKDYNDAHYYFGSLRKWAGFYTGGFGWGHKHVELPENNEYVSLRNSAMNKKEKYIFGEIDSKEYLNIFGQAEELLDDCEIATSCERDILMAQRMDVRDIKNKRRENAKILLEELSDIAMFDAINENDCPLFFPILVPNNERDKLRSVLIENDIYCPIHWPISQYHDLKTIDSHIYSDELSLLCDQRYDALDMESQISVIKRFLRG